MKNPDQDLIFSCTRLLIERQLTIAFAESATAGRICAEFSLAPEAGKYLKGGLACYDASLKEDLLGVPPEQIQTFTPESMPVTKSIATGLQTLIPADIHIGCTGLTCPGGSETPEKPVGTMFIYGIKGQETIFSERKWYPGDQNEIISGTIESVAELLIVYLQKHPH
ncbi:MAG TPA: CinA family protein [Pedobacter sp.]|nr:CinA family protein [Pedobacter sp.]